MGNSFWLFRFFLLHYPSPRYSNSVLSSRQQCIVNFLSYIALAVNRILPSHLTRKPPFRGKNPNNSLSVGWKTSHLLIRSDKLYSIGNSSWKSNKKEKKRKSMSLRKRSTSICFTWPNSITVESQYKEGPTDWRNLFALTRFFFLQFNITR